MLTILLTVALGVATPVEDPVPITETYPLDVCAVAGKKLGSMGKPINFVHEGRQVRFCCRGCIPRFKKDPAQYLMAVDQKIIESQKATYPLEVCVISNEKLDKDAKNVVINNRLVRVCCGGCARKVKKDPKGILAKLDTAIIKAKESNYPTSKCVISGEPLASNAKNVIIGNTLIKVCCKGCIRKVAEDPAKYIKMVTKAKKTAGKEKKVGAE